MRMLQAQMAEPMTPRTHKYTQLAQKQRELQQVCERVSLFGCVCVRVGMCVQVFYTAFVACKMFGVCVSSSRDEQKRVDIRTA